ncbi:hypothetical protein [Streptomyces sp. NPDC000878]
MNVRSAAVADVEAMVEAPQQRLQLLRGAAQRAQLWWETRH